MKKLSVIIFVFAFYYLLFTCGSITAAVPGVINYQGKLTDTGGALVSDGPYKLVFKLYQDNSALVWTGTFDGANKVQVTDGLFNVLLGTGYNDGDLNTIFNNNDNLYLGITIEDGSEMSPHQRIASAGYVFRAGSSEMDNPVGTVQMFGADNAPGGWLLCDGSAVSRTTYDDLFAVIGIAYGSGDGSTTFNLPGLQDRFPIGKSGTRSLGTTGGQETINLAHSHTVNSHNHPITTANLNHRHTTNLSLSGGSHTHSLDVNLYNMIGDTYDTVKSGDDCTVGSESHGHHLVATLDARTHSHSYSGYSGWADLSHNHGGVTGSASPGTNSQLSSTQSILPRYQVVNYIIKY